MIMMMVMMVLKMMMMMMMMAMMMMMMTIVMMMMMMMMFQSLVELFGSRHLLKFSSQSKRRTLTSQDFVADSAAMTTHSTQKTSAAKDKGQSFV